MKGEKTQSRIRVEHFIWGGASNKVVDLRGILPWVNSTGLCHSSSSPPRMFPRGLGKGYAQALTTFPTTKTRNSRASTIEEESYNGTAG